MRGILLKVYDERIPHTLRSTSKQLANCGLRGSDLITGREPLRRGRFIRVWIGSHDEYKRRIKQQGSFGS